MYKFLAATALTVVAGAAQAQMTSGSIGGMPYYLLPASGGCSAATPCSVVTYLSYMGETQANTASDVQNYFGGSFAQQNPHTVVIAPMITEPQSSDVNWGGYNSLTTPQQAQMVAVVQSVEQQMGNTVNPADSTVTGGSLGGNGTQAALIAYGPRGTVQPGVFSAGVSFDAATYAAAGNAQDTAALCGVPLMAVHGTADTNQSVTYDQNLASAINSNPACGNSFNFMPVQGAGHGTWGSGLSAGTGSGTALGWLTSQMNTGVAPSATPPINAVGIAPVAIQQIKDAPATGQAPETVIPGQGAVKDCSGNVWSINANTKILMNGVEVVGGGDTSDLTVQGCKVYGLSNGENGSSTNWFTMNSASPTATDGWAVSTPPDETTGVASTPSKPHQTTPLITPPVTVETPSTAGACGVSAQTSGSGVFQTINGQIVGPNGPFIARGINVSDRDLGDADQMIQMFPGLNFVRLAVYTYQDPSYYAGFIAKMTARGTVVEIEHHVETNGATGGGGQGDIASGLWLAAEDAFYASVAAANKSNPYVWFGTTNEPPNASGLSQWQQSTYNAIRGTGNNSIILLEIMGWPGAWNNAMDPSVYAQMHNVVWDTHYYGWISRGSNDDAIVKQALADEIALVQQTKGGDGVIPALVAEYGPSTTGQSMDDNGFQAVDAVINRGANDVTGSAVWHWGQQDCCNNLNDGASLTELGQRVQMFVNTDVIPPTKCELDTAAQQGIANATKALANPQPTPAQ